MKPLLLPYLDLLPPGTTVYPPYYPLLLPLLLHLAFLIEVYRPSSIYINGQYRFAYLALELMEKGGGILNAMEYKSDHERGTFLLAKKWK